MTTGQSRSRLTVRASRAVMLLALAAVAVVSFVLVRAQQGSGSGVVHQQRAGDRLVPAAVDRVLAAVKDAQTGGTASRAQCRPRSAGGLRNPWLCTLSYAHHVRISWLVQILPNGRYVGINQTVHEPGQPARSEAGAIQGCCIAVP